ncbi:MAG: [LysW]-aminoadipate kinase, partial [Blastocatellia bacterium]|nr:[LysW]-aminoadipate kinase [Blastocatellia bacterium]
MLVVKLGGSKGINIEAFCDEVARLQRDRIPMVVVHGGSHLTNEVAE